jgi:hypothetical protein
VDEERRVCDKNNKKATKNNKTTSIILSASAFTAGLISTSIGFTFPFIALARFIDPFGLLHVY